eukprot:CAMPEP_0202442978 /NCGR_PEP_ID=MMETSP1360-20130828/2340_1 /ASSEMBLY_ACC=CAM_ASM_000848 /TAXON_ID=515479 /ORGANISM="Licmophora paradoxa, Strain CCMP2313" /LENGTH=165 /DNA_ID=CAMNT_0049058531 /DNA_START=84 /DNA_END=581 /DNA_ORIENTATION=-
MENEGEAEIVTLVSKDYQEFEIDFKAGKISNLIREAFNEDPDQPVNVLRVNAACLEKVVEFLNHYHDDPMREIPTPLGGTVFNEIVEQAWYQEFVEREERDSIFDLLTAANYMGIKPLLDLTCLKVTFELTGKSADQIREILKLPELTPEEEAKARSEHKWIFEE